MSVHLPSLLSFDLRTGIEYELESFVTFLTRFFLACCYIYFPLSHIALSLVLHRKDFLLCTKEHVQ
jgi:hypothetical protein